MITAADSIIDTLGVEEVGTEGYRITGSIRQNNIPVLDENYVHKMNSNNGFSKKRMFRFIGSNPIAAELEARQQGWNLDDPVEIYKYFKKNPDYLTVKAIDTGASGKIIIK